MRSNPALLAPGEGWRWRGRWLGGNLLVSSKAVVKLADFGGATRLAAGEDGAAAAAGGLQCTPATAVRDSPKPCGNGGGQPPTRRSPPAVTPAYAAPEVFAASRLCPASDVWSLGCVPICADVCPSHVCAVW